MKVQDWIPKSYQQIISTLFFSSCIVLFYLTFNHFQLDNFDDRIISVATLHGIDIDARNSMFYKSILLGVISFFIFNLFLNLLNSKIKGTESDYHLELFHYFSLFGLVNIIFYLVGVDIKTTLLTILSLQGIILFFIALNFYTKCYKKRLDFLFDKIFIKWHLVFTISWLFTFKFLNNTYIGLNIDSLVYYFILAHVWNLISFSFLHKICNLFSLDSKRILWNTFPIFIIPMYFPLSNEVYVILNQKEIYNISPILLFTVGVLISLIFSIRLFFRKKTTDIEKTLSNYYYPAFLLVIISIVYQPSLQMGPPGELFESGNNGLAVDQLFTYGKIPLLETFNAHAFSEVAPALLFSIINGYQEWASFLYDPIILKIIYVLIAYFILKLILSPSISLLLLILFPWGILTSKLIPEYYLFALITILVLIPILKEQTFKKYVLLWFTLFVVLLWRFDLAAATLPSFLFTFFTYSYLYKFKINFKWFVGAAFGVGSFMLGIILILALIKDVPILFRTEQFLNIVSSNQLWGYPTLGDVTTLNYSLFYYVLPASIVFLVFYIIFFKFGSSSISSVGYISIMFLLCFTLFNFTRGLVRHSLVENVTYFLLGFAVLGLCIFVYLKTKNQTHFIKTSNFIITSVILTTLLVYTEKDFKIQDSSLISFNEEKVNAFENYDLGNEKIERYIESPEYKTQTYQSIKNLFDLTLKDEETFLDFSNTPYLYVFTDRVTPMYINQTPAFLSDLPSQEQYLEEIQTYSVPYAIFSNTAGWQSLDGVRNNIRSYKVAEYIYTNYTPMYTINGFDVWVKKELHTSFIEKIQTNNMNHSSAKAINIKELNPIGTHELEITNESTGSLTLIPSGNDPQVIYTINGIEEPSDNLSLSIKYISETGGNLQIFYADNASDFSESNSLIVELKPTLIEESIEIPLNSSQIITKLRLDPPNIGETVLLDIKLLQMNSTTIEYAEIPHINEIDELMWLPYYWGEKDKLNATQNKVLIDLLSSKTKLNSSIPLEASIENFKPSDKGNYILVSAKSLSESEVPNKLTLTYTTLDKTSNSYEGKMTFFIQNDLSLNDYLVRISSQLNWYLGEVTSLKLEAEQDIEIYNLKVLQGD